MNRIIPIRRRIQNRKRKISCFISPAEADKAGIPMDEREFHCKGEFKGIHKGKPDEADLKAAAEFALKIVE